MSSIRTLAKAADCFWLWAASPAPMRLSPRSLRFGPMIRGPIGSGNGNSGTTPAA